MSKYRVLRLITWLPSGGIERKILAVLPRLNPELFEVHLCCIRERGQLASELEARGVPVHLIPFRSRWDPVALWKLKNLVSKLKIDLIHSHMYRANVPATAMKFLSNSGTVVAAHYHNMDTWESLGQLLVDRWLAPRRDINLAVSDAVRRNVMQRLRLPEYATRTLYNCVDLAEFHPVAAVERHTIRERIAVPASAKVVASVARLVPQKNQAFILEAVPEVLQVAPKAHFVFIGDGPDEGKLRQMAEDLHIGAHVTFLGTRNDVPQLLAACDVSVLPSRREGFSNAILESMACGLPLIASDVGGNREIVDHGVNGYLAETVEVPIGRRERRVEASAAQFVRYLKRLLTDDELRTRMGHAALQHVQNFSLDVMVQQIEQLYLELLEA